MLILELLADGKRMPSAELEKAVNERGISSRTMRTAKSRIGDKLVQTNIQYKDHSVAKSL